MMHEKWVKIHWILTESDSSLQLHSYSTLINLDQATSKRGQEYWQGKNYVDQLLENKLGTNAANHTPLQSAI